MCLVWNYFLDNHFILIAYFLLHPFFFLNLLGFQVFKVKSSIKLQSCNLCCKRIYLYICIDFCSLHLFSSFYFFNLHPFLLINLHYSFFIIIHFQFILCISHIKLRINLYLPFLIKLIYYWIFIWTYLYLYVFSFIQSPYIICTILKNT